MSTPEANSDSAPHSVLDLTRASSDEIRQAIANGSVTAQRLEDITDHLRACPTCFGARMYFDGITDRLRECLQLQFDGLENVPDSVLAELPEWIAERRIENLAEWMRGDDAIPEELRPQVLQRLWNAEQFEQCRIAAHVTKDSGLSDGWHQWAKATTDEPRQMDGHELVCLAPTTIDDVGVKLEERKSHRKHIGNHETLLRFEEAKVARKMTDDDYHTVASIHRGWDALVTALNSRDTFLINDCAALALPPKRPEPGLEWSDECDWLLSLAGHYLQQFVRRRSDVLQSHPLTVQQVRETGFSRMLQATGAITWAIGEGVAMPDPNYAMVPEAAQCDVVARMLPRSYSLLTDAPNTLRQRMLPLGTAEATNDPLAVELATRSIVSVHAAKVALVVLSNITNKRQRFSTSIGELSKLITPPSKAGATRVRREQHLLTADGLIELAHLRAEFDDGRWFRLFDLLVPPLELNKARGKEFARLLEEPFGIGPTQTLIEQQSKPEHHFLINLKGALALPNRQPTLLRHYVRAASLWNQAFVDRHGGFDAGRLNDWAPLDWAAEVNALPARVVEYLAASPNHRRALKTKRAPEATTAKANVRRDLEHLHDLGLIRLEKTGRQTDRFRLFPPKDYVELRTDLHAQQQAKAKAKKPARK